MKLEPLTDWLWCLRTPIVQAYAVRQRDGFNLIDTTTAGNHTTILHALAGIDRCAADDVRLYEMLLTHGHNDHTGSAAALAARTGARIVAPRIDAPVIAGEQHPPPPQLTEWELPLFEQVMPNVPHAPPARPDRLVDDGDTLGWEHDAWLGRARYERRPDYQRGLRNYDSGLRNGFRPRTVQTAEGELEIAIPQVREAAEPFVSSLFPRARKLVATEPLRALVIGAFVRGLSMRDVESLCEQAGLGKVAKSTAQRICSELRQRFEQFKRRDLYDIRLVALFLDATFLAVRPDGPKEGVLIAWGFTEDGERVLLSVTLGMRESYEDWQALGRDLIARGLGAPMLVVADGAPGLTKAIEHCWPAADRQRCCVHRARNLYAKVPERERERVRKAYWQALDEAINQRDAKQRLQALVDELEGAGYTAASKCLADDLDALVVHLRYPTRHRRRWRSTNLLERSLGEVKRRTKVIGRFPGETSCLTLVWAVLDLVITNETNGIRFTQLDRQHLNRIRYQDSEQTAREEVNAA